MDLLPTIPDPRERPVLEVWPETGRILGLSRASTYAGVASGDIPAIRVGRRWLVPTAQLRKLLGLDEARPEKEPA